MSRGNRDEDLGVTFSLPFEAVEGKVALTVPNPPYVSTVLGWPILSGISPMNTVSRG